MTTSPVERIGVRHPAVAEIFHRKATKARLLSLHAGDIRDECGAATKSGGRSLSEKPSPSGGVGVKAKLVENRSRAHPSTIIGSVRPDGEVVKRASFPSEKHLAIHPARSA